MKSAVVTGASSGIGWACVEALVAAGFRVFAGVRREADEARLGLAFGAAIVPLRFDVTDEAAVLGAAREVADRLHGATLAGLVNNAGIAVPGPLLHLETAAFERQIAVNLTGPFVVTRAFAPLLGADPARHGPPGRIVMMSSVGGRTALPFLGAYNASKFGLEGMAEALRRELMPFGIDVIVVAPGTVATPIWDKADAGDAAVFAATSYRPAIARARALMVANGRAGLPPTRVGAVVLRALTARRPKLRYGVTPTPVRTLLLRTLPKRMVDRIIARRLGLR